MDAYHEAIAAETTSERKEELRRQLLAYCQLDTLALVRMWEEFSKSEEDLLDLPPETFPSFDLSLLLGTGVEVEIIEPRREDREKHE